MATVSAVPPIESVLQVPLRISITSADGARASLPMHRDVSDAIEVRDAVRAQAGLRGLIESACPLDAALLPRGGKTRKTNAGWEMP
jgi:hypothetical protein